MSNNITITKALNGKPSYAAALQNNDVPPSSPYRSDSPIEYASEDEHMDNGSTLEVYSAADDGTAEPGSSISQVQSILSASPTASNKHSAKDVNDPTQVSLAIARGLCFAKSKKTANGTDVSTGATSSGM
ncbi:hypothetical protein M422DRAFT_49695 [Sphaerobolus stellatus SS14]|uniref:Uncharacterized protein n=1 Tax=Sphaerobolus stellatus (strain SS14) TaxID=990650 RepID=A0A0C9VD10_SPHS4|nr:hypothetical protein M422DRAFT_49695 [Sphaerobolus stellatus SS14]